MVLFLLSPPISCQYFLLDRIVFLLEEASQRGDTTEKLTLASKTPARRPVKPILLYGGSQLTAVYRQAVSWRLYSYLSLLTPWDNVYDSFLNVKFQKKTYPFLESFLILTMHCTELITYCVPAVRAAVKLHVISSPVFWVNDRIEMLYFGMFFSCQKKV